MFLCFELLSHRLATALNLMVPVLQAGGDKGFIEFLDTVYSRHRHEDVASHPAYQVLH